MNDLEWSWLICSGVRQENNLYYNGKVCSKKILRYSINDGSIQVKCQRCGTINELCQKLGDKIE